MGFAEFDDSIPQILAAMLYAAADGLPSLDDAR